MGAVGTTSSNWSDNLNESQIEAFTEYMGNNSDIIRKASANETDNEDAKSYANMISKVIDKSTINSPMTVTSGFLNGHTALFGKDGMSVDELRAMVGNTIPIKGFLSSTIGEKAHPSFINDGGVELVIGVPKGNGIGVKLQSLESKVGSANVKGENEFLFNNKGSLQIQDVKEVGNRIRVKAVYKK